MKEVNGLPDNWVRVPLGELGDWYGGGTPSKANDKFWSNGKVPWFSPKDMKAFRLQSSEDRITRAAVDGSSVSVFPPDTVLMVVRSGILAHTFPVAVAGVEATMNQDLKGVAPEDGIDATYLAYALRSSGRDILNQCSKAGTTVASIDTLALHRYSIPLAPTKEQQRVVEKLDELLSDLDAGVAALERARANLKRYRAAVLKAAVEGRRTEKWRAAHPDAEPAEKLVERILVERRKKWEEAQLRKFAEKGQSAPKGWKDRYPEPARPDVASLPTLPKGWCWATVGQLVGRSEYGTSIKCGYDAHHEPVLRIPNIAGGRIDLTDIKRATVSLKLSAEDALQPGDLLVCRTNGSVKLVGKAALLEGVLEPLHSFASYLLRLRFVLGVDVARWVWLLLTSQPGRSFIEAHAASSAGQHNVSLSLLHGMPVPLASIDEQRVVSAEVDRLLSVQEIATRDTELRLRHAGVLRQSILKRAFEGKLVPQDPKDEPAGELLARIRASRVVAVKDGSGIRKKIRLKMSESVKNWLSNK